MLVLSIARLTVQEMLRRRLFLVLIGLTLLVIAFTSWGFGQITTVGSRPMTRVEQIAVVSQLLILVGFMFSFTLTFSAVFAGAPSLSGDVESGTALAILARPMTRVEQIAVVSQLLILVGFMFSFTLTFSAVFAGAPSLSGDVESGTALAILARPISRAEFVLGKWLGVVITILVYAVPTTALQLLMVNWIVQYVPPHPIEFLAFISGEGVIALTLALALSTRLAGMVGGVVALILWGVAWIGGIVGGVGLVLNNLTAQHVGTATRLILPTDGLWRGAVWALEPEGIIAATRAAGPAAAGNPFFAAESPDPLYLVWAVAWIALGLGIAIWSFSRREV